MVFKQKELITSKVIACTDRRVQQCQKIQDAYPHLKSENLITKARI